jgi:hypothetical protein
MIPHDAHRQIGSLLFEGIGSLGLDSDIIASVADRLKLTLT